MGVHLPDDLALPNLAGAGTDSARDGGFMAIVTHEFEPALAPDDVAWLAGCVRSRSCQGRAARYDALRCVEAGAAAVVVFEVRTRDCADAPPTADILAEMVDEGRGKGRGLRRRRCPAHADVVKATALGTGGAGPAAPLWALATGGADGVEALLRWFETELRRAMALCCTPTVDDIDRTWCGGRRDGRSSQRRLTTVADMLARREGPHRGRGRLGPLDLAGGRARGRRPGCAGAVADRRRVPPRWPAPADRARVRVPVQRRRASRHPAITSDQPDQDRGEALRRRRAAPPTAP